MTGTLRLALMGTPEFALPVFEAVRKAGYDIAAVYTQPPRPKGRGHQLQPTPVQDWAGKHGLPVRTPKSLRKEDEQQAFRALDADAALVVAYGLILPAPVLDGTRHGCINVHPSLLPRWRGAAPIQRAILAGDRETGVSIMKLDEGLDTGPVISQRKVPIGPAATAGALHDSLAELSAEMMLDTLAALAAGKALDLKAQTDEGATYAEMMEKEEGRIDWTPPAPEIDRRIRAFHPWPGTWAVTAQGARLKILEAALADQTHASPPGTLLDRSGLVACGSGTALRLIRVQPENARAMDIVSALNGGYLRAGERI